MRLSIGWATYYINRIRPRIDNTICDFGIIWLGFYVFWRKK